jgi:hypothetical protein
MNADFFKKNPAWFGVLGGAIAVVVVYAILVMPAQSNVNKKKTEIENYKAQIESAGFAEPFPSTPKIDIAKDVRTNYERQEKELREFYQGFSAKLQEWLTAQKGGNAGAFSAQYEVLRDGLKANLEAAGIKDFGYGSGEGGGDIFGPGGGQAADAGFNWMTVKANSSKNDLVPILRQFRIKEHAAQAMIETNQQVPEGILRIEEMRFQDQKTNPPAGQVPQKADQWPNWDQPANGYALPRNVGGTVYTFGLRVLAHPAAFPILVEKLLSDKAESGLLLYFRGMDTYVPTPLKDKEHKVLEWDEKPPAQTKGEPGPVRVTIVLDVLDFASEWEPSVKPTEAPVEE